MRLETTLSIQTFLNIYVDKLAQSHVSLAWGLSRGSSEPMKDLNSVTTQEAVFQALATIRDPDLGRDIVSLVFIKDLKVSSENVSFSIELTTPPARCATR